MKGADRLQKILYFIMMILGIYILYKGGAILLSTPAAQDMLASGTVQRELEDSSMRTWAPGYTAVMENRESNNWVAGWMRQVVPAYSYLAEGQTEEPGGRPEIENGQAEEPESQEEIQAGQAGEPGGQPEIEGGQTEEPESQEEIQAGQAGEPGGQPEIESGQTEEPESQEEVQVGQVELKGAQAEDKKGETLVSEGETEAVHPAFSVSVSPVLLEQLQDFDYLISNYYTVDGGTVADEELLDVDEMLGEDLTLQKNPDVPQILIYHTHSQEAFADSREGETEDTIVGMGETLAQLLREDYGYNVIHDTGVYDLVDGVLDRSTAYDYARTSIESILQENPSIEVVIDLHRDGVEGQKFVTEIDGRSTSMIMFFNGISRDSQDQPITYLQNPYTKQNLAFSLQLQLAAREKYPDFTRNIYLKAERFNLHLRPRSLLIEAGTQLNTVEEERNAMIPLADLLDQVLEGR